MTGAERIAAERKRQIEVWGYDMRHDAQYSPTNTCLAEAADCYLRHYISPLPGGVPPAGWPWSDSFWKPSKEPSHIRSLEKAGALIAAEIDRLLRGAPPVAATVDERDVPGDAP